jgi:NAD-dependent deacetylase
LYTNRMQLGDYKNIVVLTGAGISVSAGLPTYRGPGGLWSDPKLAELSDASALQLRRREVTNMFWGFRSALAGVQPTPAHRALAAFEERLPTGARMTIITQNIDGLHQAAGSRNVCEYHGSLVNWRCDECGHTEAPPAGDAPEHCNERMRPCVVMFGEMIPVEAERTAKQALRDCDLFVAIGTSGTVMPAANFVQWAQLNHARRILINLEILDGAGTHFTRCHAGPADELVPRLFATE